MGCVDGKIRDWLTGATRLFGCTVKDAAGGNLYDLEILSKDGESAVQLKNGIESIQGRIKPISRSIPNIPRHRGQTFR